MSDSMIDGKAQALREWLEAQDSVAVAFSGGVDSTFLLAAAHQVLGDRAIALTAESAFIPPSERDEAARFCEDRGIRQIAVSVDPLADARIRENPPDRCYQCKIRIFEALKRAANESSIAEVVEGSNRDDADDYRPGMRALREMGIRSPLLEVGLTKGEIRSLSKAMGLPTWDKPSAACLASRIPYGHEIDAETLRSVAAAEAYLADEGYPHVRVRVHDGLARIEVPADAIASLAEPTMRDRLCRGLRELGFDYICLDLEGYRTGSMNEVLGER